ncbi:LacI family transcriptional regulator [Sutcliffiella horikoshii]|uniref:LacI family DNA-binding transcriptional regulator n=1 Tax=Sutcliffiella horikoshii TaxID=79883 RepID=UPI0007D0575E|nr:LacI family DNA-binding transcriptional regulator [Sutcliffiella horikoshii]MCM3619000.1 LacI family transcriptional regulator [Sutcliffiella horikoshii]
MTTIYDIAKKTGFSITTVSKVLNNYTDVSEKTKKKILKAVEEMGYYPNSHARSLMTKKSWTIGVVFMENLGVGIKHPFFNAVIESFKQRAEQFGYDMLFVSRNIINERKSYLDHFQHRGVDGVVVVCSISDDPEVKKLMESPLPTVIIDMHSSKSSVVYSDNSYGSVLAVDYLHSLGHRKIAHIYGHQETYAGTERLKGFIKALKKHGLDLPKSYFVNGGFFSLESGEQAMKELLSLEDPPTAVYAAGDNMAIGAMKAIREQGLSVPEDISVIGFDDIEIAKHIAPPLTTVKQDMDQIGSNAADLLLEQINEKKKISKAITIPVQLMIRESCGAVKIDV